MRVAVVGPSSAAYKPPVVASPTLRVPSAPIVLEELAPNVSTASLLSMVRVSLSPELAGVLPMAISLTVTEPPRVTV